VVHNPHTNFYTVVNLVAIFEANGLISTKMELFDIHRYYYDGVGAYVRAGCEVAFVLLLVYYFLIEAQEVFQKYKQKRREIMRTINRIKSYKPKGGEGGDAISEEQSKVKEDHKVKIAVKSCFGGLKLHFADAWNWLDACFFVLSFTATGLWIQIITQH